MSHWDTRGDVMLDMERGPSLPWEESESRVVATLKPLTRDVARRLLVSLGQWHSMQELADIAGPGGWRSRVVECRLALEPCGYRLENKQGTVETPAGQRRTSAYRLTRGE